MRFRTKFLSISAIAACLLAGPAARASADERGDAVFKLCVYCHGADGAGNAEIGAPAIAGLPQWYIENQLRKFRSGARGAHYNDVEGMRMRPMALTLRDDSDLLAVARKVASMPPVRPKPTLDGDAGRGAAGYAACIACHGIAGEGNEPLKAPALANLNDWYLLRQLEKFRAGVRGTNPADAEGAMMRPMAMTLPTEQIMKDVVAHITTLGK